LYQALDLLDHQTPEKPPEPGDRENDRKKDQQQRRDPAQLEPAPDGLVVGFDHQRRHRRHRNRQKDGREPGEERADDPEKTADREDDDDRGENRDRGCDGRPLAVAELDGHGGAPWGDSTNVEHLNV
jgi:hypothetical protein